MTDIKFNVNEQILESISEPLVVAKSRNQYRAVFQFSEDWNGVSEKTAVFRRFWDGKSFTADLDENGACTVPWEVIETPRFYVSVFGGNLRTATELFVNVEKTGYDDDAEPSGTVPQRMPVPTDLQVNGTRMQLTAKGSPVGVGVEIPKATNEAPGILKPGNGFTAMDGVLQTANYELLNDITLEEDVKEVIRERDDQGNTFKLRKFLLIFIGKITPGSDFTLRARFNGGVIFMVDQKMQFPQGSEQRIFWVEAEKYADGVFRSTYPDNFIRGVQDSNGAIFVQGTSISSAACKSNLYLHHPATNPNSGNETATRWHFNIASTDTSDLLTGSRILVWGVRE